MNNQTLPQTLKGFRDFLPADKKKRDFVKQKMQEIFERFGFEPLETPTLEYASLLLGKYGDEADKLVYTFDDRGDRQVGLRYDQTVPTARVLAQYQATLPKFFRRYQIQNVFRADKPQKGRFREFTQCDIDIFGSSSSIADAEILSCVFAAISAVGFKNVQIKINDRKTLIDTLTPFTTPEVTVFSIIQSVDKLDKQTPDQVKAELVQKGLTPDNAQALLVKLNSAVMSDNLQDIISSATSLGVPKEVLVFTPSLARGLDYYTGMIFEVSSPDYGNSSLGGGGRYDNLIEQLGGNSTPAVGIGFGFDRIVEAADELKLLPSKTFSAAVLVTIFDETTLSRSLEVVTQLRQAGIAAEIYPSSDKLAKQFKLADQKGTPFVVVVGPDEVAANILQLKNMKTGDQWSLNLEETVLRIKQTPD